MRFYVRNHQDGTQEFTAGEKLNSLLDMLGIYLSAQTQLLTIQSRLATEVMEQSSPPIYQPKQEGPETSIKVLKEENERKQAVRAAGRQNGRPRQHTVTHRPQGTPFINPYEEPGKQINFVQEEDLGYGDPGTEIRR